MKTRNLILATSLITLLSQFGSPSHASNSGDGLPDDVILHVFSYLKPTHLGNRLKVSREFQRLACHEDSPLGKLNHDQEAKDLYTFCKKDLFGFGEVEALAKKVNAMTINPTPQYVSNEEFEKAKYIASQIVKGNL